MSMPVHPEDPGSQRRIALYLENRGKQNYKTLYTEILKALSNKEQSIEELGVAGKLGLGPWIKYLENIGIFAQSIASLVPGMDSEMAYIVGVLHDIGRILPAFMETARKINR